MPALTDPTLTLTLTLTMTSDLTVSACRGSTMDNITTDFSVDIFLLELGQTGRQTHRHTDRRHRTP